ncbi:DUF4064 domain-containing protein [Lentibacillus cibarius]|uniref:DUF4064 domain-containing protein n=1 Tax=Lentibacillus cibarius TaxID=2583219 RepID=A0A549YHD9_9BACI|nr:DUF4064 domain-containing protein [Lentibacillus cibarius]TRM11257.1 DUF4064 domain-containing protein [Lentibacillus cibarius]
MNRTGEIVLTIVGALIYGFFTAVGAFMVWIFNNEVIRNKAKEEVKQQQPEVATGDLDTILELFQGGGWFLIIVSVLALVVGIVSIFLMKGDKNPKVAGIMLIVTAVIGAIITVGAGIFSGLFYLIAGIMCLARKKQATITME